MVEYSSLHPSLGSNWLVCVKFQSGWDIAQVVENQSFVPGPGTQATSYAGVAKRLRLSGQATSSGRQPWGRVLPRRVVCLCTVGWSKANGEICLNR